MKKPTILIVDDNHAVSALISDAMIEAGYAVLVVEHYDQVLHAMSVQSISLAIVDCVLPRKSGLDLCKEIEEKFPETPCLLITGFFKDKQFLRQDQYSSIKEVFFKPLEMPALLERINQQIGGAVNGNEISLQELSDLSTKSEIIDAITNIKSCQAFELPQMLIKLLSTDWRGRMILTAGKNEICFEIQGGCLQNVIGASSAEEFYKQTLISEKLVDPVAIDSGSGDRSSVLDRLSEESLLSPHMAQVIGKKYAITLFDQILSLQDEFELKWLSSEVLSGKYPVSKFDFLKNLCEKVDLVPIKKLKTIFADALNHYFVQVNEIEDANTKSVLTSIFPEFFSGKNLYNLRSLSFKEFITINKNIEDKAYQFIYILISLDLLALGAYTQTVVNSGTQRRLERILVGIEGRNHFEVMQFLGTTAQVRPAELEVAIKRFTTSNHPDLLPQNVSDELKKINQKVFAIVQEAYNILREKSSREKYQLSLNQKNQDLQEQADHVLAEGINFFRLREYTKAKTKFKESYNMYPTEEAKVHQLWADLKTSDYNFKVPEERQKLDKIHEELMGLSRNTKNLESYLISYGLWLKAMRQFKDAYTTFQKARKVNPSSLEANREIFQLKKAFTPGGAEASHSNISSMLTGIFKKSS